MLMVKVHFLTPFDVQINKFLYLQYLDRFGCFGFCPLEGIHQNAARWCSVSTCIELPLIKTCFSLKMK